MRRKWRPIKPKVEEKKMRSNHFIKVPEVFLIDENGVQIGPTPTFKAIEMAKDAGYDLVEVNPKASPPVAKIVDLGQLKYEREKKAHKQKLLQKKVEIKQIRLSVRISKGDLDFRLNQAIKFLEKGNKLKIDLILKGREKQHPIKAVELINDFVKELKEKTEFNISEEQPLTKQGGRFNIILINKTK